jgi:hypothetical protein
LFLSFCFWTRFFCLDFFFFFFLGGGGALAIFIH